MKEQKNIYDYGGLYQNYYENIKNELIEIKEQYDYPNLGISFAHWYIYNFEDLNENEVQECIVDGGSDWGIDAIIIGENLVRLFQFKFPTESTNIRGKVDKQAIENILRGYSFCSKGTVPSKCNDELAKKINEIDSLDIFNYEINVVSFQDGISEDGIIILDDEIATIKQSTGNTIQYKSIDKKNIIDAINAIDRLSNEFEITLSAKGSNPLIISNDDIEAYTIYASLIELSNICENHQDVIFDENVRLFHGVKNKFNEGIINTATSQKAQYFHLYNNGITIIADDIKYHTGRTTLKIKNPYVINGCQTMNSLLEAKRKSKISDEGFVQVTVIKTQDHDLKQDISIFLNSQTEIKDSYLISNLPIIKSLERFLSERGYFFERQPNKIKTLKNRLSRKEFVDLMGKDSEKIITLDSAIQTYATFFCDLAPVAKANKNKLFDEQNLNKILKHIDADKIILSQNVYKRINMRISDYRKFRRNPKKDQILDYLGITEKENEAYIFLNTADIFLLSGMSIITNKKYASKDSIPSLEQIEKNFDQDFKIAIECLKKLSSSNQYMSIQPSLLTKNASFHKHYTEEIFRAISS